MTANATFSGFQTGILSHTHKRSESFLLNLTLAYFTGFMTEILNHIHKYSELFLLLTLPSKLARATLSKQLTFLVLMLPSQLT